MSSDNGGPTQTEMAVALNLMKAEAAKLRFDLIEALDQLREMRALLMDIGTHGGIPKEFQPRVLHALRRVVPSQPEDSSDPLAWTDPIYMISGPPVEEVGVEIHDDSLPQGQDARIQPFG